MKRAMVALTVAAVVLSACGGDDDAGSPSGDAGTSGDTVAGSEASGSDDGGTPPGGGESATVQLGGATYEFSSVTCTLAGFTLLSFAEGSDNGGINVADPVVLVRLAIAGGEWVDNGAAPEPERSGDTFTWSGPLSELASGDEAEATITVRC